MQRATEIERGFVQTPAGAIHYRMAGQGDPLVLLHQTPRSMSEYLDVIPLLARHKQVIALDMLGYGDSDRLPRAYSIEDYAKTMLNVMDGLHLSAASIVGQHLGGLIAAEAAASYPDRVKSLVLIHAFELSPTAKRELVSVKPWQVQQDGSHLTRMWKWAMARTGDPNHAHQVVLDLLKAGESNEFGHWAAAEYKFEKRWRLIQCPTLLVWGGQELKRLDDRGWNATKATAKLEQSIAGSRGMIIPEAGALFPVEMPQKFASAVLNFLDGSTTTRPASALSPAAR